MIEFAIKSTLCLAILYWFYYFFLRSAKIQVFNRWYLLFSLFFALIVPTINIRMNINQDVIPTMKGLTEATLVLIQGEEIPEKPAQSLSFQSVLTIIYLLISSILLLRFIVNIYKIVRLIRSNTSVNNPHTTIVLLEQKSVPYSFFKYIFINRFDHEKGNIDKGLILHEQAHCLQLHSIDIIIVELVKIVLWFNPFIWFFSKAIQLNHEYLADSKVLSNYDLVEYQNLLINLTLRNNSTYLASNFNYSLTKKRLIMMTKKNSLRNTIFRKIATIPVFLILFVSLAFSQENMSMDSVMNYENEWWYPILKKHNIEPSGFNNYDNVFEMGTKNSINNSIATLENAFFLIKPSGDEYLIIKSTLAFHNLDKNTIEAEEGIMETYKVNSGNTKPSSIIKFKNIDYQLDGENSNWKANGIEGWIDTKE